MIFITYLNYKNDLHYVIILLINKKIIIKWRKINQTNYKPIDNQQRNFIFINLFIFI